MAAFAHPSLTNSQLSTLPARRSAGRRVGPLARLAAIVRLWRQRLREKDLLVRLTDRELADFGATRADIQRVLAAPFWRAPPPC